MSKTSPSLLNPKEIAGFLQQMFAPALNSQAFVEVRWLDGRQRWFPVTEEGFKGAAQAISNRRRNACVGLGLRSRDGGGRNEDVIGSTLLWVDLDTDCDTWQRFPLQLSALINSGHGGHAYWWLDRVISVPDFIALRSAITLALGGDVQASKDPSRVARIPGAINHNPGKGPPVPLTIQQLSGCRYSIGQLRIAATVALLHDCWQPEHRHRLTLGLAGVLARGGISQEEAAAVVAMLVKVTGDPEGRDRLTAVRDTYRRHGQGKPVQGYGLLQDIVESERLRALSSIWHLRIGESGAKPGVESQVDYIPIMVDLGKLQPQEPEWIWTGWIPRAEISLVTGDPEAGKTYALLSLITTFTHGWFWPDGSIQKPGRVLYLDAENGANELKRRLVAQGMNQWDRLRVLSEVSLGAELVPLSLEQHLAQFHAALAEFKPDWVIIDPLVAFHERNEISATEMRRLLRTLTTIAREYHPAITFIQHPNKNASAPDLYRVRGTLDFIAAARAVLRVTVRKNGQRVLVVGKLNLAPKPKPQGFLIGANGLVEWTGEVEEEKERKIDIAKLFLKRLLANGPVESNQVKEAAEAEGIPWRTVQRARAELPIEVRKSSADGPWVWELSGERDAGFSGVSSDHDEEVL
jgi:putative DNA primase/helicase